MKRGLTGTILWTLLAVAVGAVLFLVKYEVKDLEARLAGLNAEIHRNQETIHVLRAEWSYLNDPIRLRTLSEKHLGMKPVTPTQVATLDTLPKDGIPATGVVYAAVTPSRMSMPVQAPAAQPPKPADPKLTPVKLAEGPARPRPVDNSKPQPGKPQPPKPGTVTMAQGPTVKPQDAPVAKTAAPAPAPAPAKGGRSIVIPSPALAQTEQGGPR
ncbi:Cell division protein FtsL [Paramagnetospirillum magnetotacticum MS-1]|uniref:Cell division protein FtsL n=1 Tax=Paramagnetospirillum magnetotacticum MS-1 TaxID=272627 RepID=A0A0C2YNW4_PARME|nr:energy transducer TonB [Paramagnetospirillum magnetotacticum]KIL96793.1 Cell division protein FtsL [Paramagnetospirillum magnetotacticum MS-1]